MADGKQGAQEAWRAYLELALGVTEASKKRAQKVAKRLAGRGGATAQQLQSLADGLVSTSLANREGLTKLVRFEVDRALGAVGLATAEEVAELQTRVADLERQVHQEQALGVSAAPGPVAVAAPPAAKAAGSPVKKFAGPPAKKAVAKKAVAKTAVAKKATKVVVKKAAAEPAPESGSGPAGAATGPAKAAKRTVAKAPAKKAAAPHEAPE